ncbi:conjugal transfer protein TraF [Orientia tsutsugamushi]|uniref:conjugal transfer protein TraF n=1 Tax=Orientia tsutsugamushi TaxID=784 RepID=UPI00123992C7|nr:conjugal transfer protein TraF [Orientia tsutsugamushi]QES96052.1 conjugal transfer protein TraF [Orientia tsutsugamushi]QES96265.1 conjugal transfer protein TraF [Orientia tsutsugamushi]QES96628.1 conjugal transfer protein TraF [Orientia tsutsugamushi]
MSRLLMFMILISHLSTVDASPTGFLWYNDKHGHELTESTSKLISNAHDHRIEELKEQFNRAQRIALDNPTLENVIIAQRLQKKIMEKAHKFATMWQLATLLDYQLINAHEPSNSLHRKLYQEKSEQKNDSKLKNIAKNWGLILQVKEDCLLCKAFMPIVQCFANKYAFQLLAVSKNNELLNKLNPKHVVPVLYLVASDGKKIYAVARGIISEDKIIDNILAIDRYYHKLETR